ncbi:MAG: XRE family transcriptional regulator [Xanthomonadales bacterium]|jgi:Zn-dependent peptidase ImmA (M78 family)|nr:XRE family transcriptional regulator [Xanthomonadales bacterium]
MERIDSINPQRIRWCCADLGVSLDDLAAEIDVAPATLSRVMVGEGGLSFRQLSALATYFGRDVLFFVEPGPVAEARVHSPPFRSLAQQRPTLSPRLRRLIARVEQQREVYRALREEVPADELPRFAPPSIDGLDLDAVAAVTRRWLGLGDRNDFASYRRAVESRGVLVFRSNGYAGAWQIEKGSPVIGFALYHPDCPVILVRKQRLAERQSFTLMHELAHLLLHRSSWIDEEVDLHSDEGREAEANAFAGRVLVPAAFLAEIRDADRPAEVAAFPAWLQAQCRAWGASVEVILRRLLDTGRLSAAQYAAYRVWSSQQRPTAGEGGSREWRHREPTHLFGEGYVRTVLDALSARRISLAKASTYLDHLTIADLHKLESHHAGA